MPLTLTEMDRLLLENAWLKTQVAELRLEKAQHTCTLVLQAILRAHGEAAETATEWRFDGRELVRVTTPEEET